MQSLEPLINECIKCGTKKNLTIDHLWPVAMLGTGRKIDINLKMTELTQVISMRENLWYLCQRHHINLDRLKLARFLDVNVCNKVKCPLINPDRIAKKIACRSFEFCDVTSKDLRKLEVNGKLVSKKTDLNDVTKRGNPLALARFNKDSYPITTNPRKRPIQINALIRLQNSFIEAVGSFTTQNSGLSPDVEISYLRAGLVVADHLRELNATV